MTKDVVQQRPDMFFAPLEVVLEPGDTKLENEEDIIDRFSTATMDIVVNYVSSPARRAELLAAGGMIGFETVYDIQKVTHEGNKFGNDYLGTSPDLVGMPPQNLQMREVLDSLGDIFEISFAQSILRIAMYEVNKYTGKELIGEDKAFWISLVIPVFFKALHSLGLISILGIHDRVGHPVPEMLIGQAVASAALIYAHYSSRKKNIEKELATSNDYYKSNPRVESAVNLLAIESSMQEGEISS